MLFPHMYALVKFVLAAMTSQRNVVQSFHSQKCTRAAWPCVSRVSARLCLNKLDTFFGVFFSFIYLFFSQMVNGEKNVFALVRWRIIA